MTTHGGGSWQGSKGSKGCTGDGTGSILMQELEELYGVESPLTRFEISIDTKGRRLPLGVPCVCSFAESGEGHEGGQLK